MLCSESLCRCRATPHIDGMKRTREAFAGVRSTHGSGTEQHSDLTCCAYGHECAILRDDASAALLDSDQHLQSWSGDDSARVDRYDVRLLLHSVRQLGTASNSTASASEAEEAEDLDFERYRDLYPQASATPEPEQDSAPRSVPGTVNRSQCTVYKTSCSPVPGILLSTLCSCRHFGRHFGRGQQSLKRALQRGRICLPCCRTQYWSSSCSTCHSRYSLCAAICCARLDQGTFASH